MTPSSTTSSDDHAAHQSLLHWRPWHPPAPPCWTTTAPSQTTKTASSIAFPDDHTALLENHTNLLSYGPRRQQWLPGPPSGAAFPGIHGSLQPHCSPGPPSQKTMAPCSVIFPDDHANFRTYFNGPLRCSPRSIIQATTPSSSTAFLDKHAALHCSFPNQATMSSSSNQTHLTPIPSQSLHSPVLPPWTCHLPRWPHHLSWQYCLLRRPHLISCQSCYFYIWQ